MPFVQFPLSQSVTSLVLQTTSRLPRIDEHPRHRTTIHYPKASCHIVPTLPYLAPSANTYNRQAFTPAFRILLASLLIAQAALAYLPCTVQEYILKVSLSAHPTGSLPTTSPGLPHHHPVTITPFCAVRQASIIPCLITPSSPFPVRIAARRL